MNCNICGIETNKKYVYYYGKFIGSESWNIPSRGTNVTKFKYKIGGSVDVYICDRCIAKQCLPTLSVGCLLLILFPIIILIGGILQDEYREHPEMFLDTFLETILSFKYLSIVLIFVGIFFILFRRAIRFSKLDHLAQSGDEKAILAILQTKNPSELEIIGDGLAKELCAKNLEGYDTFFTREEYSKLHPDSFYS